MCLSSLSSSLMLKIGWKCWSRPLVSVCSLQVNQLCRCSSISSRGCSRSSLVWRWRPRICVCSSFLSPIQTKCKQTQIPAECSRVRRWTEVSACQQRARVGGDAGKRGHDSIDTSSAFWSPHALTMYIVAERISAGSKWSSSQRRRAESLCFGTTEAI